MNWHNVTIFLATISFLVWVVTGIGMDDYYEPRRLNKILFAVSSACLIIFGSLAVGLK